MADETIPLRPNFDRQLTAKRAVEHYINAKGSGLINQPDEYTVFVVWFTSVLDNWKAMVSTTIQDGRYYEVTYNGAKKEIYIDVYEKVDKLTVVENATGFRQPYFDNINE